MPYIFGYSANNQYIYTYKRNRKQIEMDTEYNFNRAWGFAELAMLYFPNIQPKSASSQLRKWIRHSSRLTSRLEQLEYRPHQKLLMPAQIRCIVNHLGEPGEE